MDKRRYPTFLFVLGIITNFLFHFFWLLIPALLLLLIGIFIRPCLYIGLALLALDALLSLLGQFRLRRAFMRNSDNAYFTAFQDALSKDGSWFRNLTDFLNVKNNADK